MNASHTEQQCRCLFFSVFLSCFVLFSLLTSTIQRECESLFTGMCHVRGQIRHLVIVYGAFNWLQSSRSFSLHCVECLRHFNFLRCADTLLPNETICIPDVSFSIHSSLLSLFLSLHSVILSLLLCCARAIQKDDAPFCNYLSCCAKYFLLGPMCTPHRNLE